MKNILKNLLKLSLMLLFVFAVSCKDDDPIIDPIVDVIVPTTLDFVGSQKCSQCHQDHYNRFIESGHPYKVVKINGKKPDMPYFDNFTEPKLPLVGGKQYTWADISYTIGGYGWKMRFIDKDGYTITGSTAQWNPGNNTLTAYNSTKPVGTEKYDCGACHTTGWVSKANGGIPQDNLPGMDGQFKYGGVHCEACHGMGNKHAVTKSKQDISIKKGTTSCNPCHWRRNAATVDNMKQQTSGGWEMHRNQYEQINTNKHASLSCNGCHDAHSSTRHDAKAKGMGVKKDCKSCHTGPKYADRMHYSATCIDCHMPKTVKNGIEYNKYRGDAPNHNFKINIDPAATYFTKDAAGTTWANQDKKGSTLDFACYSCHKDVNNVGGTNSWRTMTELNVKAATFHK
ncbi:MAG: multiheme c-type cytochrome [Flavobacteriaceae bacterium]|nr:multiheme c-type cytochrome [Flavobacteriaceae bacterium]